MFARFEAAEDGFDLHFAGRLVLRHRRACPALALARGASEVTMYRGNFRIEDAPSGVVAPIDWRLAGKITGR